ncbi:MAG TPA: hypothetical protein VHF00_01945 [Acidimicrobiales bacterium]|nr:hypothetical protein [Acidimicrobiales bacterium]
MGTDDDFTLPQPGEDAMPSATPEEIVADEIGDVAVEDPERAARLVSAVTTKATGPDDADAAAPAHPASAGRSAAERAVPAAIVGVLVLQVLPKGRLKRLALAVLGSALVAGLVAGKQEQRRVSPPGR